MRLILIYSEPLPRWDSWGHPVPRNHHKLLNLVLVQIYGRTADRWPGAVCGTLQGRASFVGAAGVRNCRYSERRGARHTMSNLRKDRCANLPIYRNSYVDRRPSLPGATNEEDWASPRCNRVCCLVKPAWCGQNQAVLWKEGIAMMLVILHFTHNEHKQLHNIHGKFQQDFHHPVHPLQRSESSCWPRSEISDARRADGTQLPSCVCLSCSGSVGNNVLWILQQNGNGLNLVVRCVHDIHV